MIVRVDTPQLALGRAIRAAMPIPQDDAETTVERHLLRRMAIREAVTK